jgi:hypothetical protein
MTRPLVLTGPNRRVRTFNSGPNYALMPGSVPEQSFSDLIRVLAGLRPGGFCQQQLGAECAGLLRRTKERDHGPIFGPDGSRIPLPHLLRAGVTRDCTATRL